MKIIDRDIMEIKFEAISEHKKKTSNAVQSFLEVALDLDSELYWAVILLLNDQA